MKEIKTQLIQIRSQIDGIGQRRSFEAEQLLRQKRRMLEIEQTKADLIKTLALIDQTINVVSANGIGKIESTVTEGLRLVFNDPTLSFKIQKTLKKDGTRGTYYIEGQQGDVSGPILETFGGGVANVVSFLLRVIMIKRFQLARVLVLDESFNNVSAQVLPAVSDLLRSLATDGGYTILAVTHQPILASASDHVYLVEKKAGASTPTIRKVSARDVIPEQE